MEEQVCRFCRCTDRHACPDGCSWIKQHYCSACYDQHMGQLIHIFVAWVNSTAFREEKAAKIGERACSVITTADRVTELRDHIGMIVFRSSPHDGVWLAPHYDPLEIAAIFAPPTKKAA